MLELPRKKIVNFFISTQPNAAESENFGTKPIQPMAGPNPWPWSRYLLQWEVGLQQ